MKISNLAYFTVPAIVWGTTWYAITFQLGEVDPLVSVSYRFLLAGIVMAAICWVVRTPLKFDLSAHFYFLLMGSSLFGLNYWLVYLAQTHLASGVVALTFSTVIFFTILFNRLLLKAPVRLNVALGGIFGFAGTLFIFRSEIAAVDFSGQTMLAFGFCLGSTLLAALGNIIAAFIQKQKIPVLPANAYAMYYGALVNIGIALALGKHFAFETSFSYVGSLLYLSLFGSVLTFGVYLKLIGKIGPDKAVYVAIVTPVIALIISTIFENFVWTWFSLAGSALVLAGNYWVLKKKTNPCAASK